MAENPLYGDKLLELGKALTSEIHAIVENGRAYYLGLSPHEPPSLLSKVFNPETGPIIPYLVKIIRIVVFLSNPKHPQSIYHACERTFHFAENGYVDEERLYLWCHRNESRIWAWVETYRLDHSIS